MSSHRLAVLLCCLLVAAYAQRCDPSSGTQLSMQACSADMDHAQQWVFPSNVSGAASSTLHPLYTFSEGLCADAGSATPAQRNALRLEQCSPAASAAQHFFVANESQLVHAPSGLCASVEHDRAGVGALIDLFPCAQLGSKMVWTFDESSHQVRADTLNPGGRICLSACTPAPPAPSPPPAPAATAVVLNGSALAHRFDGITAMSVNGAARLLYEYPEPTRSELLDMFFTPRGMGTAWQALKVEIGGDVESSYGSMSSYMHVPEPANASFARGVQFWLIAEARKRNPSIPLLCLSWGMPYWVGNGTTLSAGGAKYHVDFLLGAKREHGIDFDYVGIWNEAPWSSDYIKLFRKQLDEAGLRSVGIVAADGSSDIIKAAGADAELAAAIAAFGDHGFGAAVPELATNPLLAGKPFWESENDMVDGPMPQWGGTNDVALGWAGTVARNYARANGTATMLCAFVHSWSQTLGRHNHGPLMLNDPWSGFYQLGAAFFSQAHWTQFSSPGWRFIADTASAARGSSGKVLTAAMAPDDGSEITLVAVNQGDTSEELPVRLVGGTLARFGQRDALQLWRTEEHAYFQRIAGAPVLDPLSGELNVTLPPRSVTTLSSVRGAGWANYTVPRRTRFPLPHAPDFSVQSIDAPCLSLSPIYGAFEIALSLDLVDGHATSTRVCRQPVPQNPGSNAWTHRKNGWPVATLPSGSNIANAALNVTARIEPGGLGDVHAVSLCGRVPIWSPSACMPLDHHLGVCLTVLADKGAVPGTPASWRLTEAHNNLHGGCDKFATLASGTLNLTSSAPGDWHTLSLRFSHEYVEATIDGTVLVEHAKTTLTAGVGAIGSAWNPASYRDLHLAAHAAHAPTPGSFMFDLLPSTTLGDAKFTGWAGFVLDLGELRVPPGAPPVLVRRIGRFRSEGNSLQHALGIVNATDGTWLMVPNSSAASVVDMGTCTAADALGFCYGEQLDPPLELPRGGRFYVVSSEVAGGDTFVEMTKSATGTDMGHRDGDTLMTYALPTGANAAHPMAAGASLVAGRVSKKTAFLGSAAAAGSSRRRATPPVPPPSPGPGGWTVLDDSSEIDTSFGPLNLVIA